MMGTARAGFIEFQRPKSIDRSDRDPERILAAIVEQYRKEGPTTIAAVYDQNFNLLHEAG
jgi:hypothetical protein